MSRSVSTPRSTALVTYTTFEYEGNDDDGFFAQHEFDDCVDNLTAELKSAFPSLYEEEKWLGREDRSFLQNRFAYIGLSEYCGLIAVWVVVKEDEHGNDSALGAAWASKIENKFSDIVNNSFGTTLVRVGTFSNGEAIFRAKNPAETKGDLGLGFSSKEGWM